MIKYLILVCLITAPFAQTPEAIVTHYDLEGNLIQEESSLQGSEDIDSMNSMNMNQQDLDTSSMDLIGTDSMDYSTPQTESVESNNNNIESSMNYESTVSNMNIDNNSMMMNTNDQNSLSEQDSMQNTNDPNDISAIEEPIQQNLDDAQVIESTEVSNIAEVNSEVISNNMIAQSNEISNIDPNNVEIQSDNQIDVSNILESNVEFTTDSNIPNQNEVDPNMAFDILTNTESLQSSPEIENGFVQSELNTDKTQTEKIPDTQNIQEDQKVENSEQKLEENQIENKNNQQQNEENKVIIQSDVDSETKNNDNAVKQDDDNHNTENHDGDQQLQQSESQTLVQGDCIIIYSQCNFKGEALEACNSLSEIEEFKAQIRSIYIPEGLGLTVYDGENFTGNMHKFKSSQECLKTPLSFAQLNNPGNELRGQNLRSRQ